jgi:hypothetical protein
MPLFKAPIHASYILYLAQFSKPLAKTYWHMALTMCRAAGVGPSLLLHPLDFMGCDDDRDLAFFPAMGRPAEPKIEIVAWMIDTHEPTLQRRSDERTCDSNQRSVVLKARLDRNPTGRIDTLNRDRVVCDEELRII